MCITVNLTLIRKTCLCNIYPLKPHFYIEKLGFAGVHCTCIPIFLIFAPKHEILGFFFYNQTKILYIAWACFRNLVQMKNFNIVDAVYSDDLTTLGSAVMRVPYFSHIHKRENKQSQKMDEMEDQLETVKKRYTVVIVLIPIVIKFF